MFTEGVDYTWKELLVKEGRRNLFMVQEGRERREGSGKGLIDIGRGKICCDKGATGLGKGWIVSERVSKSA